MNVQTTLNRSINSNNKRQSNLQTTNNNEKSPKESSKQNRNNYKNSVINNYVASKENKTINNNSNKISEISNTRRFKTPNKNEILKSGQKVITNNKYDIQKHLYLSNNKMNAIKPQQKNLNSKTYNTKLNTPAKLIGYKYNKSNENINKNNTLFKFGEKKPYKSLTYKSTKKDNLTSYNKGTTIIITSSKINDDKNSRLNKGRIHHMVTVRTTNNNRPNSTAQNNGIKKTENNSINISNNYKKRALTIISSKEDIELEKDKKIDNNNRKDYSAYNNKQTKEEKNFTNKCNPVINRINANYKNKNLIIIQ